MEMSLDFGLLLYAEHSVFIYQDALALCAIRARETHIEVMVEWDGLSDALD